MRVELPAFRTPTAFVLGLVTAAFLVHADAGHAQGVQAHPTGTRLPASASAVLTAEQLEILDHMSLVNLPDGRGGFVETVRFTGVNVQIVNGLGATNGLPQDPGTNDPAMTLTNGAGNLIVGYNELGSAFGDDRTGSHNIVVGTRNSYSSYGGTVGGSENEVAGAYASVQGGGRNRALAELATVGGGVDNLALAMNSTVSGGTLNQAIGNAATVSGGMRNTASGDSAAVSGGIDNVASGDQAAVSGGSFGQAMGMSSSVSGGSARVASGTFDWAAGTLLEDL